MTNNMRESLRQEKHIILPMVGTEATYGSEIESVKIVDEKVIKTRKRLIKSIPSKHD